jgi:putative membrane protein insertion efficiency factor
VTGTAIRLGRAPVLVLIRLHQWLISPWLGPACRFEPTCSRYAELAVERHGVVRGMWLALRRLARRNPLGGSGFDPVP